jgi:hypothetical protein
LIVCFKEEKVRAEGCCSVIEPLPSLHELHRKEKRRGRREEERKKEGRIEEREEGKGERRLGVMVHSCNPSTQETET